MSSTIYSAAVWGLDAVPIEVEIDASPGLHMFCIVGLPDKAVEEAKERVGTALRNSGFEPPHRQAHRVIVNLAPADFKKEGPAYDLPIAIGFLHATQQLPFDPLEKLFIGELALDGAVRSVSGILPAVEMAVRKGSFEIFLPAANAPEARLVSEAIIYPVRTLAELVNHLKGAVLIEPYTSDEGRLSHSTHPNNNGIDFAFIQGQEHAKRALEIAASGQHNVIFEGPPGSGKTLLAQAMLGIMPKMTDTEIREVTKIYSVAGLLSDRSAIMASRPFRNPHHTASAISLTGGGTYPRPGEITLAHRGVLFLDEFPEFARGALENLRQPLEEGHITVSRAQGAVRFPARFTLVAAMNPCPCGYATDKEKDCTCPPAAIFKYQRKISGPLLDRIDLHVEVPRLGYDALASEKIAEESGTVRDRVEAARHMQQIRFDGTQTIANAEMGVREIKAFCKLDKQGESLLKDAVTRMKLSGRSYHHILKVARTIADLAASSDIHAEHIAEAVQYRKREKSIG
ncbi:MAG: YifB family Mg chelatase-like AAA ATPase [bacterium]|nr:YifB family Mg chelatase-like AAA ATPase [bacterium]